MSSQSIPPRPPCLFVWKRDLKLKHLSKGCPYVRCKIPRSVLALWIEWFGLKMNDSLMHITICSLAGVILANAAFFSWKCHTGIWFDFVRDSNSSCLWVAPNWSHRFWFMKVKNTSNSLWMCCHFTFCAMAALLWLWIELPYMTLILKWFCTFWDYSSYWLIYWIKSSKL